MSRGFHIRQDRADTPGRIHFACSGGGDAIVAALTDVGFVACGKPSTGLSRLGLMQLVFNAMAILLRAHRRG